MQLLDRELPVVGGQGDFSCRVVERRVLPSGESLASSFSASAGNVPCDLEQGLYPF